MAGDPKDALVREVRTLKKDVIALQEEAEKLSDRVEEIEAKIKVSKEGKGSSDAEGDDEDDPTGLGNL